MTLRVDKSAPDEYSNEAYKACMYGYADAQQQRAMAAKIVLLVGRVAELEQSATAAEQRVSQADVALVGIHNYAHELSTGPTVPDGYWSIRGMAAEYLAKGDPS